jgi:hypothetical protein
MRQADDEVAAASFLSLKARVARALLQFAKHLGEPTATPDELLIRHRIRQDDLAALANVARENASRILRSSAISRPRALSFTKQDWSARPKILTSWVPIDLPFAKVTADEVVDGPVRAHPCCGPGRGCLGPTNPFPMAQARPLPVPRGWPGRARHQYRGAGDPTDRAGAEEPPVRRLR